MRREMKAIVRRCVAGILCTVMCLSFAPATAAERLLDRYAVLFEGEAATYDTLPTYGRVLAQLKEEGMTAAENDLLLDLSTITFEGTQPQYLVVEGKEGLLLDEDTEQVTFAVNIPADGLYEMEIVYYPYAGSGQAIRRAVLIDGETPFSEAENACLYRHYSYVGEPRYNGFGDQLTYDQEETRGWFTAQWQDVDGKYASDLLWAFKAGSHTLTLSYVDQPLLIHSITLKAPAETPDYATVSASYPKDMVPAVSPIKLQAELPQHILYRTDSTVNGYADNDPATEPAAGMNRVLNAVGGSGWSRGNQEIVYRFQVEESGLYTLALRVQQPWTNGMNAYRQILVDGELPFAELAEYAFPYAREWYTEVLSNEEGTPYRFYLEEGPHTITVKAVMATELTAAIEQVRDITDTLSTVYRKILLITGAEPDSNYDYDLEKSIPDLLDTFTSLETQLNDTTALILGAAAKQPSSVSNLYMIRQQIEEMREDPDCIPGRLEDITNSLTTLGNMITNLQSTPLGLDELVWYAADDTVEVRRSNLWQKIGAALKNFWISVQRDYTSVVVSGAETDRTIDVWVSRGSEWATVMQRLIQGDFENKEKIGVNLNVLPSGTLASTVNPLLLAITSGDGPDVVLNVDANTAVEYGVRGMAKDLREFADYAQVVERFHPEIEQAFTFLGKTYALPETMNFYLMAYRKDILSELSLGVPETWQEVYYQTLPVLYQNGMEMLAANLDTYLYQYGGDYYTEDGLDTALDTAAAHQAFADSIAQYQDLGFPISANFFSRFRTGEMPIGFIDYTAYLQILTAAPELAGKWSVAPVPGIAQEDGRINRATTGLTGTADMLLTSAADPDACWAFLKWWTEAQTQTAYGLELESMLGASARLNTSNLEAFCRLPWSKDTLSVIRQYWDQAQVVPNVLGGVITSRAINNATNLALYESYTPREALETAVKVIRDELIRKQSLYEIGAATP
ncbi:MAG: extracellular solute-binding protein [Clostridia bacterium]|nr:extracellular solute-binding protein [Clostridia bacterium]